jgi:Protein of unknown function (DUF1559)
MVATTGVAWIWLLLLGGGGLPIPFSLPPLPEDPVMSSVAPDECLWYLTWSGSAKPDPKSKNQTEALLAEEEIQRFGSELEMRIVAAIREHAQGPEAIAAQEMPKLLKIALTRPTAVFIADVKFAALFMGIENVHGGLIINLGDQTDEVKASLDRLAALLPQPAAAGKWQRFPSHPGAPAVEWGIDGKYLIVGIGDGSADAIVAREKGKAPKWLSALRDRLKVERPAMVHYLNIKKIVAIVQELSGGRGMPGQVFDALGLSNLTSLSSVSGLDGTGWASNSLLAMDGPPAGIFALSGGDPLSAADLAPIPKDATFALAGRLDLDRAYRGISEIAVRIHPQARMALEQGLAMAENQLGVDLSRDIFKALGDTWCVYSAPSEGGLLITGLTVVVPVRDHERLAKAEARLRGLAQAGMAPPPGALHSYGRQPQVTIADFEFRGNQIHFLNFVGEPVPVAPAWCITDKELIVSLSPQSLKAHLSRKADAGSLADVPAIKGLFSASKGPQYVGYADSASIVQTLYPLVQFGFEAISSGVQREGIPIDLSIFPSAAAILPHIEPSVSSATMTSDGLLMTRRGTLPMEFETLPLLIMPYFFVARSAEMRVRESDRPAGARLNTIPNGPGGPERIQSTNNLRQIALALLNHAANYRVLPAAYIEGAEGKRLLSWRVKILPFLGEKNLYKQFHLDEPWDSEHNKPLIEKMPRVYAAAGSQAAKEFKTVYVVPRSHGNDRKTATIFSDDNNTSLMEIRDGTSMTILAIEANDDRAVIWTKPDDYDVDFEKPMAGLVGLRQGGFLAAFADGSVHFLKDTLNPDTLKALFTRDGGERIDRSEL